jgi:3-dehydroquinate synthase
MPRVAVEVSGSPYEIVVGPDMLRHVGPELRALGMGGRAAIVTHPDLPVVYHAAVHTSLEGAGFQAEMAFVPQGEESKSLAGLETLYHRFAAMRLDRCSTVVALGGGVIGDLAGFAAATYMRGVSLVQVPTTLLAQVDASVGGKTAIDLPVGKNLVGAFYQPRLVVADVDTLQSLPERERRSGLAEVVKYGMIADAGLFAALESDAEAIAAGDLGLLTPLVVRSCEIKADVVRQDPHERGLRAILNYGHTLGHALEAVLGFGVLPHGYAVAVGMSAAARLAVRLGLLDARDARRQDELLRRLGLPTLGLLNTAPGPDAWRSVAAPKTSPLGRPSAAALLEAMLLDKKSMGGHLRFVLARGVGAVEVREVAAADVVAVLEEGTV